VPEFRSDAPASGPWRATRPTASWGRPKAEGSSRESRRRGAANIVDRHIRSLRIKLQNDYRHPRFIETVLGEGYRFIPTFSNLGWSGGSTTGDRVAI
jgi:hypothetical protein